MFSEISANYYYQIKQDFAIADKQEGIMCKAFLYVKILFICATVFMLKATFISGAQDSGSPLDIIPRPAVMKPGSGSFLISPSTIICVQDDRAEMKRLGRYFAKLIRDLSGFTVEVRMSPEDTPPSGNIVLSCDIRGDSLGDEGYTLNVTRTSVAINAQKTAGVFYGIQTVRQILIASVQSNTAAMKVPAVSIEDKPRYMWRGFQLDCSRRFMELDYVKRYIDLLALHKLNIFHWHLTDDQGWRLEILRYPKLTTDGAWYTKDGVRHGGYYSQDEVREVINYAKSRYVEVIPEIELPGHATAAISAYPELSCDGKKIEVETIWGIHKNLFCAGKESTFDFLENVLKEVSYLFPSEYVHIGGDEAQKDKWIACPLCQKRIKDEGLKDEAELQGYFTRRIDTYMQSLGKSIIGWDEVLEGHPSQTAIIQSWRGMEGAIEGANNGHRVISSPASHVYLDFPNTAEGLNDTGWLKVLTLEKIYSFEATPPELSAEKAKLILGGESPLWAERTPQPEVDNNVFPRLCALSETVWSPKDLRDWNDFSSRMRTHFKRLDALGVDYYKESRQIGTWEPGQLSESFTVQEWDITEAIQPGHLRFTTRHDEGENNIVAEWVALYENGVEIGRDKHEGLSGTQDKALNYRFEVYAVDKDAKYTVKISMKSVGGTDAKGSVMMRHFNR